MAGRTDRHGTGLNLWATAGRLLHSLSHERNGRVMTEKSKMSEGVGCVVGIGGLLLAAFVAAAVNELVKHYPVVMSVGGTVSGVCLVP